MPTPAMPARGAPASHVPALDDAALLAAARGRTDGASARASDEWPAAESDATDPDDVDPDDGLAAYPPVVALLVTRNPGEWFEETLLSLGAQDYPDLTVLVVDCSSDADPTARVAALLPRAFVRRVDTGSGGFATAANEALAAVEGAPFLLLCHDDVALDQSAVRLLVEEAYRSNAAILGPKLVSAEDPEILLEVGRSIDRFGAPYTGIEPGEIDQEQHDGVRDVFYVPTATMLVRSDLFATLGGFDPETFPGAEDLDLCWRARLAGARVLVVPDARVAHHEASGSRGRADRPSETAIVHSRVRALLASYSLRKLLWLVPAGIVVSFFEFVGNLVIGHPRRARASIVGWWSNLLHPGSVRRARKRAQSLRAVHDSELRELQISTTARVSAWFGHHLHQEGRLRDLGVASRSAVDSVSDGARAPATLAFLAFLGLVLLGSRDLFRHGVPPIGTFASWPSVGSVLDAFGSAWRFTGLGSASAQPPALLVVGGLGAVLLGATGLAHTLFVVLALPIGAIGMYRLAQRIIVLRGPAFAAAIAYGVNPVGRNSIAQGQLGALVLFALLPFLLLRLQCLAEGDARKGRLLRLAVLAALLGAFYPLGLAIFVAVAALLVVAVPLVPVKGTGRVVLRAFGLSIAASLLACVLLLPWPLAYVGGSGDAAAVGFAYRPSLTLSEVLRFDTGPATASWVMWGLVFAAAVPLFLATGSRLAWAARGWVLALAGWAAVWVPATFFSDVSVPTPEAGLTVAALGLSLALGVGVSVLVDGVRGMKFGWRQPAAILGAVAVLLPFLGFVVDVVDGRWDAPTQAYTSELAFTGSLTARGQFRMLWIGNPEVLPLDPVVLADGTGYTLTRNGSGDVVQQWRAREHDADHVLDDALGLASAGLTGRLGRMLAPMGIRYVVLPTGQGQGGGAHASAPPGLRRTLDDQIDLARLRTSAGITLYENLAYAPLLSVVPDGTDVPRGSRDPNLAALGTDLSAAVAVAVDGRAAQTGTLLWQEAHDSHWEADGVRVPVPSDAFGWTNGYAVTRPGAVSVHYTQQWQRWVWLAGMFVIWVVVLVRWRSTRARRDPAERAAARERRMRERRLDSLPTAIADDTYYWERV